MCSWFALFSLLLWKENCRKVKSRDGGQNITAFLFLVSPTSYLERASAGSSKQPQWTLAWLHQNNVVLWDAESTESKNGSAQTDRLINTKCEPIVLFPPVFFFLPSPNTGETCRSLRKEQIIQWAASANSLFLLLGLAIFHWGL